MVSNSFIWGRSLRGRLADVNAPVRLLPANETHKHTFMHRKMICKNNNNNQKNPKTVMIAWEYYITELQSLNERARGQKKTSLKPAGMFSVSMDFANINKIIKKYTQNDCAFIRGPLREQMGTVKVLTVIKCITKPKISSRIFIHKETVNTYFIFIFYFLSDK